MKAKIGILSLGCPRNLVDSENLLGRLNLKGYPVVDINTADVALINTCAFIDEAKKESVEAILDLIELKKEGKLKKILVYGCLPGRYKDSLRKELPEVDAFIGKLSLNHNLKRFPLTPRHYAYLKICEGCVNNCSFCIIPKIKGKFLSLGVSSILEEVKRFNCQGLSELNIIGQDITGYGLDLKSKEGLAELLPRIARLAKEINWIRLLYLNPGRLSDKLLAVIRDEPKICKYIDLPIQHINSRILKLMNRGISGQGIIRVIEKIRKTIPGVALRTSVIVGFPGETGKEFKELLNFIKDVKFERLGAFTYSREEGTRAYNFKGQVPDRLKSERLAAVMSVQQEVSRQINSKFLGKSLMVLVDEEEDGSYLGRTQYDAPEVDGLVYIRSKHKLHPGDFVRVRISDTLEYDLVGEVE
ncbi:MAG: 30S ribosomal protein S12 methylthiotransferase RimO [Candidatus Omnitrophota bacterium]|jgi:ribosomal protein S12 methylthiotransferase|nr:30S ribosomal protein S12 methylthiotransferase RimO [Candidatus Omnitrophota bacterium]MDD5518032.1 30S ribosomal protein S12 methylthiotransferase RimO [Candidatus Omnitrophota bacterium]